MKRGNVWPAVACALVLTAACGDDVTVDGSGGSGATTSGSGGATTSGSGGATTSSGTGGSCPELPSCNWCGGDPVVDENGCTTGWLCANGADPCATNPCGSGSTCPAGEVCRNQLCWGCQDQGCGGGSADTWCICSYACDDGSTYDFECQGNSCSCQIDGVEEGTCMPDPQTCVDTAIGCCGWSGG